MATTPPLPKVLQAPLSPNVELLLESRIPARLAWVSDHGTPQVLPIWFHWTGATMALSTFAGSRKLRDIVDGSSVAITIDTDSFPYRSLKIRGTVTIESVEGLSEQYRQAAVRYLGPAAGDRWCTSLAGADQVVIHVSPTWAVASDMSAMPFMSE